MNIVEKIHHEFKTAGDRILDETYKKKAQFKELNSDRAERLKAVGFKQMPEIKKVEESKKEKEHLDELSQIILNYNIKHPTYKFITKEEVERICEKYNLVYGDVSKYKGDVPEKNLIEIENFLKVFKKDYWQTGDDILDMSDYEIRSTGNYYHFYLKTDEGTKGDYFFQQGVKFEKDNFYGSGIINGKYYSCASNRLKKVKFFICAPSKDMDTSDREGFISKIKDFRLTEEPKDPIILQPVPKGFLIVTAWGDEAEDELTVNQRFN